MPASNTDAQSTLPSQLAAVAIHKRFAHRPSFFSVVFNALRDRIMEHYPTLEIDLRDVKLASPHPDGGWEFKLLSNVATEHVLNPQLLDLSPRRELPFYLTQNIPTRLKSPAPLYILDMQVIANIIAALPSTLYIYFQQALADHWSESDTQGSNRWQWFGEFLKGQMMAAAASRSDLDPTQRDMLSLVAAWPERLARLSRSTPVTGASFIETTLKSAGKEERLLTPDLLLIRGKQVLLYGVAGTIELFDSIDAFGKAWGLRMQRRFEFDSISWRRNEPDGNVFEQQAGLILNQQLEDLGTMKFQCQSERALERRLDTLTAPALLFSKVPEATPAQLEQVRTHLPEWVTQASVADRFAYHRHLQDMAQVLKQNQGRSFNEGIASIHTFSRDALRRQMRTDHGDQDPDDVMLDFSVAAGYPGGAGFIGHVKMSLTELALKNLAGKPKGTLKLSSKSGKALPNWLDADYVLAGPSVRSLKRIKADAEKIVNERARIEGNIRFEQRQLKDPRRIEDLRPWEWDHMLTRPAEQLESLANEIQRGHSADANAVKLAGTYLAEAQAMKTQAREFCREGYLLQRPRASNIEYLLANDFVKITLVKTHFPLQAGDFLTEYAVHDKRRIGQGKPDDNNAVWYAHFHYPTVDTPKLQPQFAHLKTHAERLVTRRQLFEQAQKDARAVINLNKEIIALPLAKKLFLEMENQK